MSERLGDTGLKECRRDFFWSRTPPVCARKGSLAKGARFGEGLVSFGLAVALYRKVDLKPRASQAVEWRFLPGLVVPQVVLKRA